MKLIQTMLKGGEKMAVILKSISNRCPICDEFLTFLIDNGDFSH